MEHIPDNLQPQTTMAEEPVFAQPLSEEPVSEPFISAEPFPGPFVSAEPWNAAQPPKRGMKKGLKIFLIIAGVFLVLLTALIIVGFSTNWFGFTGPVVNIARAADTTFTAENLSADFYLETDTEAFSGSLYLTTDPETETLAAQGSLNIAGIGVDIGIYREKLILGTFLGSFSMDLSAITEQETESDDVMTDLLLNAGMEDKLDTAVLEDCLMDFVVTLNDEDWLLENASYSLQTIAGQDVYTITPDLYVFTHTLLQSIRPAFYKEADFEAELEKLEADRAQLSATSLILTFWVKPGGLFDLLPGTLTGLTIDLFKPAMGEQEATTFYVDLEFYEIGTTKVDLDYLQELLENAASF